MANREVSNDRFYKWIARRLPANQALVRLVLFVVATGSETAGLYLWLTNVRAGRELVGFAVLFAAFAVERWTDWLMTRVVNDPPAKGLMSDGTPPRIRAGMQATLACAEVLIWTLWLVVADTKHGVGDGGLGACTIEFVRLGHAHLVGGFLLFFFLLWLHSREVSMETEKPFFEYVSPRHRKNYFMTLMETLGGVFLLYFVDGGHSGWAIAILATGLAVEHLVLAALRRPQKTEREWLQMLER